MQRIIFALFILFGFSAYSSEFNFQAGGSEFVWSVGLGAQYELLSYEGGAETESVETQVAIQLEYGVLDSLSLGVLVPARLREEDTDTQEVERAGFEDLELFLKGWHPLWGGSFRYSLDLMGSLEDREVEDNGDSNNFSGGLWARLSLGYEHLHQDQVLGFRVSKEVGLEERIESAPGGEVEVEGTEEMVISFFHEGTGPEAFWGKEFSHTITSNRLVNRGAESENLSPIWRFALYRVGSLGDATLVPRISIGISPSDRVNGAAVEDYVEARLGVIYRR